MCASQCTQVYFALFPHSIIYVFQALLKNTRRLLAKVIIMFQFSLTYTDCDLFLFHKCYIYIYALCFSEKKIQRHLEENSHCPEEYEAQLVQCYDGMQTVLARASNKLGCLQYAEAHRKRSVVALPNFQATCRASNHSLDSSREVSSIFTFDYYRVGLGFFCFLYVSKKRKFHGASG